MVELRSSCQKSSLARGGLVSAALAVLTIVFLSQFRTPAGSAGLRAEKPEPAPMTQKLKAHETSVSVGQEFFAGSPGSIHCAVHRVKSITETIPVPGADVIVRLRAKSNTVHSRPVGC